MLTKISLERLLAESSRLQDHRQRNCVIRSVTVESAVLSGRHVKTNVDVYERSSPIPEHTDHCHVYSCKCTSVSQKIAPKVFWHFFNPEQLGIFCPNCTRLLHVPIYAWLQIYFTYLQLWRSYATLSATTQQAFRPMVDILSVWWWSR